MEVSKELGESCPAWDTGIFTPLFYLSHNKEGTEWKCNIKCGPSDFRICAKCTQCNGQFPKTEASFLKFYTQHGIVARCSIKD